MEKLIKRIKNRIEAITGRSILVVYRTWSVLFIKKEGFLPPATPIRRQEILLIKRESPTYRIAARKYFVQ